MVVHHVRRTTKGNHCLERSSMELIAQKFVLKRCFKYLYQNIVLISNSKIGQKFRI